MKTFEFTDKEVEFILAALDRVQVQGVETALQLIEIVNKLQNEPLENNPRR